MRSWTISTTSSSSKSSTKKRINNSESTPLLRAHPIPLVTPSSYGALIPYYQFLKKDCQNMRRKTLHRSESMLSLCFRSLTTFIADDNLQGLKSFLENKQVIVDDRDENGTTALMVAAVSGRLSFVRELINHGADVNIEDADGWTALICAAKEGHADICHEIILAGADVEHREMGGWTALMWAAYKGRTECVNVLVDKGADVNAHGNYHISSLLWASGRGNTEIVEILVRNGAKVNIGDKYGTTALIWACRKGHTNIVEVLLRAGANVDTAGMYSWTPLLVATMGNFVDIVSLLLEHKPNVNALDKDGCTALTLACKEGFYEIAIALINASAYINIQDRIGDTNLIYAVKGGHKNIVEALLKKYADVDIAGKDRKTAVYTAVEKGNVAIVKLLLTANPDLEITTKDNDTCLLRAVKNRHVEIVQLLLDKKAKVNATDKKGDNALHIAMRARSKAIVEILLRNPKNSQLLYRPNKSGETAYNIDMGNPKTILGQIFGARKLNTNEDTENALGYDLYSSALADMLSEPSLTMPITVGLYAKWGSGKSFLLKKLRDEMKLFARQWADPNFQYSTLLFLVILHFSLIFGAIVGVWFRSWTLLTCTGTGLFLFLHFALFVVQHLQVRYDWEWPYNFSLALTNHLNHFKIICQILFCQPSASQTNTNMSASPMKFFFTDQTRISTTTSGENSIVQMLGSLYDAIESDYGALSTRLYRAFHPRAHQDASTEPKYRKLCCLPYAAIFEITVLATLVGACALAVYLLNETDTSTPFLQAILIVIGVFLSVIIVANLYTWARIIHALAFSQRRHLQKSIAQLDTLKSEGFLQALKREVNLMTDMVKCLDRLTSNQTRLVVIVDGLDSCEQDKVLIVLDAIHVLFSDVNSPFIIILAIDPHAVAKAVEINSRRVITETDIGGQEYLRNMVHLPFYLQNSSLRRVKAAQQTAAGQLYRRNTGPSGHNDNDQFAPAMGRSVSSRRLSTEGGLIMASSSEKLKPPGSRKEYNLVAGSRKLKMSESIASSIGSNLNRVGTGAYDLTNMLRSDDYFSDVTPRSMRRLMNVIYITGRLLKAFQIDFNWYHLARWVNITEQWPYRTSWLILYHELHEETLEDNASLKSLYDKIRPKIPMTKDVAPLLELDRDEKKFDILLTFHRSSLLVSDMKIFLPFTINLDPYIKKVIKEVQQSLDDSDTFESPKSETITPTWVQNGAMFGAGVNIGPDNFDNGLHRRSLKGKFIPRNDFNYRNQWNQSISQSTGQLMGPSMSQSMGQAMSQPMGPPIGSAVQMTPFPGQWLDHSISLHSQPVTTPLINIPKAAKDLRLSSMTVAHVSDLIANMDDMNPVKRPKYTQIVQDLNITGRVLLHCDLSDLKAEMQMAFGDWELFRMLIICLRQQELTVVHNHDEKFNKLQNPVSRSGSTGSNRGGAKIGNDKLTNQSQMSVDIQSGMLNVNARNKQSVVEKQVTLEEQMICGALQTLNEEACEDVFESDTNFLRTSSENDDSSVSTHDGVDHSDDTTPVPGPIPAVSIRVSETYNDLNVDETNHPDDKTATDAKKSPTKNIFDEYTKKPFNPPAKQSIELKNIEWTQHSSMYAQNSKHDNIKWNRTSSQPNQRVANDSMPLERPLSFPNAQTVAILSQGGAKHALERSCVSLLSQQPSSSVEKLKGKILNFNKSSADLNSDDESTPLVSDQSGVISGGNSPMVTPPSSMGGYFSPEEMSGTTASDTSLSCVLDVAFKDKYKRIGDGNDDDEWREPETTV